MLAFNTLINENSPEAIEQKLIFRLKEFANETQLSKQTINQHLFWIIQFVRFHNGLHPSTLNQSDIESFLSSLALEKNYTKSMQEKALHSIKYLYVNFLKINIGECKYLQTKNRNSFKRYFDSNTCHAVLSRMSGSHLLMAKIAYLCQLTLNEVVQLKVSDIDIKKNLISVYKQDGSLKYRATIPLSLILDVRIQKMRANQKNSQFKRQSPFQAIRTQNIYQHTSSQPQFELFSHDDKLLFPISDGLSSSEQTFHKLRSALKNDIKIAIKQYSRIVPLDRHSNKIIGSSKSSHKKIFNFQPTNIESISNFENLTPSMASLPSLRISQGVA